MNKTLAAGINTFTYTNLGFTDAINRPNKPVYMLFRMAAAVPTPVKVSVYSSTDASLDPTATSTTRIIGTTETRLLVRIPRGHDYSTAENLDQAAFRIYA
ncbi:MAG: hypothetical protein H7836_18030, partial [Magnetococcus sp. YQC-3]